MINMDKNVGIAFVAGALIGAGVAILLAPQSGEETRKAIATKAKKISNKVKDFDFDDVREFVDDRVEDVKSVVRRKAR